MRRAAAWVCRSPAAGVDRRRRDAACAGRAAGHAGRRWTGLRREPAYLGRVLALFNALCAGGVAVSMLCYGPLADRFGAGAVCLGGAVATVIPYLVFALDRDMRRLLEQ